jgi:hypothetical protein
MILSPFPQLVFLDNNGRPAVGYKLFTYEAGTTTKVATYTDEAGGSPNANPIELDYRGSANVWLDPEQVYKFVFARPDDTDPPSAPIWSVDDISAPVSLQSLTRDLIGFILFPQTAQELAGGVTPDHYYIQPVTPMPVRYGAVGDGATPDNAAFAKLEDAYSSCMIDLGGLTYFFTTTLPSANIYFNGQFAITSDDAPRNTAYGWQAFRNNTFIPFEFPSSTLDFAGGNYNTAIGSFALNANTDGRRNTACGAEALQLNTTGFYNTAVGALALHVNLDGGENVALGVQCMQFNEDGSENVAIGNAALLTNISGDFNVAIGRQALRDSTTASGNTAVGRRAMLVITTGADNVAVGEDALSGNETGTDNTVIGDSAAGAAANFSQVVAIGSRAAAANTANSTTAVGTDALISNTSGTKNTAVGFNCLATNITGINHTAVGESALVVCTGDNDTAIGTEALTSLTTGDRCSALGYSSGSSITTEDNCTTLGYNAQVTGSNQLQLGDSNTTSYAYGAVQNRSDARDKADVRDTALGLDFLLKLRPVDFRWDYREDYCGKEKDGSKKRTRLHHGLIAQEVKAAADAVGADFGGYQDHAMKGGKDVLSLGYGELIAPLVRAIQQQQDIIMKLTARVAALEKMTLIDSRGRDE